MKTKEVIKLRFNPVSYSISRSSKYQTSDDKSGNNNQNINFQGGGKSVLNVEMQFAEEADGEDVYKQVERIEQFLVVQEEDGERLPQKVAFIWGSVNFEGYITSVKTTYTRFTREGKPIRATASLEMENYGDIKKASKGTSQGVTMRTATEDMDIWDIAYQQYEDSSRWREIADANHITDPRDIKKGTPLIID